MAKPIKKKAAKNTAETAEHAAEVRAILRGQKDIVECAQRTREEKPAAFQRKDLMVVRSWSPNRPIEPPTRAAALVQYPRMWNTRHGRYTKFTAPGMGAYGLVRARPSF